MYIKETVLYLEDSKLPANNGGICHGAQSQRHFAEGGPHLDVLSLSSMSLRNFRYDSVISFAQAMRQTLQVLAQCMQLVAPSEAFKPTNYPAKPVAGLSMSVDAGQQVLTCHRIHLQALP